MQINWDEPKQGELRAYDNNWRVLGRVRLIPHSSEYTASVGYNDLGTYISENGAKQAVERAVGHAEVPHD